MQELLKMKNEILKKIFEMSEYTNNNGIIGWIKREDYKGEYVYGEITGYFLSFCSYIYKNTKNSEKKRKIINIVKNNVAWLDKMVGNGMQTRYMFEGKIDWRNNALFAFDFAMIIRGLNDVSEFTDSKLTLDKYLNEFKKFLSKDKLIYAVISNSSQLLPNKWSTNFDIHLMKVAANLYGVKGWDNTISINIYKKLWNLYSKEFFKKDSHPIMYFFEGTLLLLNKQNLLINNQKDINDIVSKFKCLIVENKVLYNNPTQKEYIRSDVLAQVVRIGSLLYMYNHIPQESFEIIKTNLQFLLEHFYENGFICFYDKKVECNFYNIWCGMFTVQAIDFFSKAMQYGQDEEKASFMIGELF